ncbi:unnamed protein product, partial [Pocillopora meandrina]
MHHAMPSGLEIGTVAKSRTLTLLIFAVEVFSMVSTLRKSTDSEERRRVPMTEDCLHFFACDFSSQRLYIYSQLEKLIEKNHYLHKSAREAYRSYLQAYASHQHKSIFNVNALDLQRVAPAFGFVSLREPVKRSSQGLGTFSLSHPCDKKKIHLPRLHH